MQARKSIIMQWNYILLVVHYSVLIMLNARLWDYSFLGWSLLNLLLAFILHQVWSLLVHPKTFKPVLPRESTISTYVRYSFAVLRKFACAIFNFQNKLLFYVFVSLAERWGVANIFHAGCVILTMSVYSLVIAWEYDKGIRDAQSEMKNEFTLCCQIINSLESVGMDDTRGFG